MFQNGVKALCRAFKITYFKIICYKQISTFTLEVCPGNPRNQSPGKALLPSGLHYGKGGWEEPGCGWRLAGGGWAENGPQRWEGSQYLESRQPALGLLQFYVHGHSSVLGFIPKGLMRCRSFSQKSVGAPSIYGGIWRTISFLYLWLWKFVCGSHETDGCMGNEYLITHQK